MGDRLLPSICCLIGPDPARNIMAHDAESRTLERYYLNLQPTTDLTGMKLAEPTGPRGRPPQPTHKNSPLANEALSPEVLKKIHGPALNALVRKMTESDPNYRLVVLWQKGKTTGVEQAALRTNYF
jgi:hypothetical protein